MRLAIYSHKCSSIHMGRQERESSLAPGMDLAGGQTLHESTRSSGLATPKRVPACEPTSGLEGHGAES